MLEWDGEVVGRVGDGLAADEEFVVGEEGDGVGEVGVGGAEEDGLFAADDGHGGDEGLLAFGRGAGRYEVDGVAVRGEFEDLVAGGVGGEHGAAGGVVAVLGGAFVERDGGCAWVGGVEGEQGDAAVGPAGFGEEGEVVGGPVDAAEAHGDFGEEGGLGGEGCGEGEEAVVDVDLGVGVAVVAGFDPGDGGGSVGAPVVIARAGGDGVEGDGEVVDDGAVEEHGGDGAGFEVDDEGAEGIHVLGEGVAEGAMDFGDEGEAAVRGGLGLDDEAFGGERADGAGERDAGELRGGVVLEDGFVGGRLQHVLVGAGGGDAAEVLFDVGAGGDFGGFGRGAAVGGDGEAEELGAVGHPLAGLLEDGVEVEGADAVGAGGRGVDDPELETVVAAGGGGGVGALDECDVMAVRRPEEMCGLELGGEPGDGVGCSVDGFEGERDGVDLAEGPLVCGLKRMPARRKRGWATSAMEG